jgi:site-specific DNA-methyltransferase (adenine-specific)
LKPYYADGAVTLYHGDCRDVLPALPQGRSGADLLLTDPPYGHGYHGRSSWAQAGTAALGGVPGDDGSLDVGACLAVALRALRPQRHVYVFGPDRFAGLPVAGTAELIWDKGIPGLTGAATAWAPSHERIGFGVYVPSTVNRGQGRGALAARLRRGTVLRVDRPHASGVKYHPTEKPVALIRDLIESSSCRGETVLDPFAGSGSTGVAAVMEGRRAVLIELEERYCEVAADRLRKVQPALVLFQEAAG